MKLPSSNQQTKRGGGAFHLDGKPGHWATSTNRNECARCGAAIAKWREEPCFYPVTLEEVADDACKLLEAALVTTAGVTPREAGDHAKRLRAVLSVFPHAGRLAEVRR